MRVLFITGVLLWTLEGAFGHGMDKPGPHGGQIQMPGAFHTEVLEASPGLLHVYLLDDEFKNPVTQNSSVTLKLGKQTKAPIGCQVESSFFKCELPSTVKLTKGESLQFTVSRKGAPAVAVYKWPLAFPKKSQ